jgi:hypothetical protein
MQQWRYCWKWCFLFSLCKGVIRRTTEVRRGSWKEAAIQRGLDDGNRGTAIVRRHYQEMSSEDTADLERISVICKVWKSVMALKLSVIMSCVLKWSINPISSPKPCQQSATPNYMTKCYITHMHTHIHSLAKLGIVFCEVNTEVMLKISAKLREEIQDRWGIQLQHRSFPLHGLTKRSPSVT